MTTPDTPEAPEAPVLTVDIDVAALLQDRAASLIQLVTGPNAEWMNDRFQRFTTAGINRLLEIAHALEEGRLRIHPKTDHEAQAHNTCSFRSCNRLAHTPNADLCVGHWDDFLLWRNTVDGTE